MFRRAKGSVYMELNEIKKTKELFGIIQRKEIDIVLNNLIKKYANNIAQINKFVLDSCNILFLTPEQYQELLTTNYLKELWGASLIGNPRVQDDLRDGLDKLVYYAEQMIKKLISQNIIAREMLVYLRSRLSLMYFADMTLAIINTRQELFDLIDEGIAALNKIENKNFENSNDILLHWQDIIEYQVFKGREYPSLNHAGKTICLVNDFYREAGGKWSFEDLLLLRETFEKLDIDLKKNIKLKDFFEALIIESDLADKIFEGLPKVNLKKLTLLETPLLFAVEKVRLLKQEEAYIANALLKQVQVYKTDFTAVEANNALLDSFLANSLKIESSFDLSLHDIVLSFLTEFKIITAVDKLVVVDYEDVNFIRGEKAYYLGDFKTALNFLEKAVKNSNPKAMYYYGQLLSGGFEGVESIKHFAEEKFRLGARLGHCFCQFEVANLELQYNEKKAKASFNKVFQELVILARDNDREAQWLMGQIYNQGIFVNKDEHAAYHWYKKSANQGYFRAKYYLGNMYYQGKGVNKDYAEAAKNFEVAADYGYILAQYILGNMYYAGQGIEKNDKEAVRWYLKAAENGNDEAMNSLGNIYYGGSPPFLNYFHAFRWYKKAAEVGHIWAQYNLGNMYYHGRGTRQNYKEAFRWYKKAAEQGNVFAINALGMLYYAGKGIEQDFDEAVKWYKKAAELGYEWGQFNLGNMYELGKGVEQDYKEALTWYLKAAEQGNQDATERLRMFLEKKADNIPQ